MEILKKESYVSPEIDIVFFEVKDIITTSNLGEYGGDDEAIFDD